MTAQTATVRRISDHASRSLVVGVLLLEHDPISRHVLAGLIEQSGQLRLVGALDSRQAVDEIPLLDVDVVLLAVGWDEDLRLRLPPLVARGARVLVLDSDWSCDRIQAAVALGARGCLVKAAEPSNLIEALSAVAAGHSVLAPDLLSGLLPGRTREHGRMSAGNHEFQPPNHLTAAGELDAEGRGSVFRLAMLTTREREVLRLLASGCSTKEAAAQLHVSPSTVKSHISHALTKLDVRNRLEAVLLLRDEPRLQPS
jgi:two-component system, NarL family, nitrate/nitrite response regulator NarL